MCHCQSKIHIRRIYNTQRAHLALFLSRCPLAVFDFMTHLSAERTGAGLVGFKLLPDDGEVWLVCGKAQHDQIS